MLFHLREAAFSGAISGYRKHIVGLIAVCFSGIAVALPLPVLESPIDSDPVVIDSGLVSGTVLPSGVRAYLGIPFAAPPVRELRWEAPQPVESWDGVYYATRLPTACMQTQRASDINHYFGAESYSEDCLYLNVWAPEGRDLSDLPVVVWIYGGAFNVGSSAMRNYSGEFLPEKDVIVVSMNYRVGVFGYMAHPELSAETDYEGSGNYGFMDQLAALEWIQNNIEQFGGDPDNVMLVGQSAGSMSISVLQASPLSEGLFHKAFGMSGSLLADGNFGSFAQVEELEQGGLALQEALEADSIEEMRALAADVVFDAARQNRVRTGPAIDGYVLPDTPREIFARGEQTDAAIVLGYTRDEAFSGLGRGAGNADELHAAVAVAYPQSADVLVEAYLDAADQDVGRAAMDLARDSSMGLAQWTWADLQASTGTEPVFAYFYSKVHPYAEGVEFRDHNPQTAGAYHTGEVPYFLQTMDYYNLFRETRTWTQYDRDLSELMSDTLVNFAKTGNPSVSGLTWPAFDAENPQMIEFGEEVKLINWPHAAQLELFRNVQPQPLQRSPEGGARD
jgi:para-nitrobenzyl esterase